MRGFKKITAILVIALMAIGVGYAAWQEELTINTNVYTGKLSLVFKDTIEELDDAINDYSDKSRENSDYVTISGSIENNRVGNNTSDLDLSVSGLYPGAEVYYVVDIVNMGSIPAIIQDLEIDPLDMEDALPYIDIDLAFYNDNISAQLWPSGTTVVAKSLNQRIGYFESATGKETVNNLLASNKIEPGEKVTMVVGLLLDESVTEDQVDESSTYDFKIKFKGKQFNIKL